MLIPCFYPRVTIRRTWGFGYQMDIRYSERTEYKEALTFADLITQLDILWNEMGEA